MRFCGHQRSGQPKVVAAAESMAKRRISMVLARQSSLSSDAADNSTPVSASGVKNNDGNNGGI